MVNNRTFKISHEFFSYFTSVIDLYEVDSISDIIDSIVLHLRTVLQKHDLESLCNKLNDSKFHIHDYSFADILQSNPDKIFYICSHCS